MEENKTLTKLFKALDQNSSLYETNSFKILDYLKKENNRVTWNDALARLLNGVGSSTRTVRLVSSKLLGDVLYEMRDILSIKQFCKMLDPETENMQPPKPDDIDVPAFRILLAVHSVLTNKSLISDPKFSSTDTNHLLDVVFKVGQLAAFARELAYGILSNALMTLPYRVLDGHLQFYTLRRVSDDSKLDLYLEGITVYLAIRSRSDFHKYMTSGARTKDIIWDDANPLSKQHSVLLGNAIRDLATNIRCPSIEDLDGTDEAEWSYNQPNLWRKRRHYIWDSIAQMYSRPAAEPSRLPNRDTMPFEKLWKMFETKYFGAANRYETSDREITGYNIIAVFVRKVDISYVPQLFTTLILADMASRSGDSQDRLRSIAFKRICSAFLARCDTKPENIVDVWRLLLSRFSDLDKSSTLSSIHEAICEKVSLVEDEMIIDSMVIMLQELFLHPRGQIVNETERAISDMRNTILNVLFQLIKRTKSRNFEHTTWRSSALKFLLWIVCFRTISTEADYSTDISISVRETNYARMQFELLVGTLSGNGMQATVNDRDGIAVSWAFFMLNAMLELEAQDDKYVFAARTNKIVIRKVFKITKKVQELKKEHQDSPKLNLIELFLSTIALFAYTGSATGTELDDVVRFSNTMLNEFAASWKAEHKKRKQERAAEKKSKKRKINAGDDVSTGEDVIEGKVGPVLIEMILTFSTKKSLVLKDLCENLMKWFADLIDEEALQLFYDVLSTKESLAGQNELFDVHEDGDDDEEIIELQEDEDGVGEQDDDNEEDEEEEEEESEDSDDEDSEAEEDGGEDGKDFEQALSEVLQVNIGGVYGPEDAEEEDDDMTDEQMLALDSHISSLFKDRVSGTQNKQTIATRKKLEKQARETIVFTKLRAIDMLSAFLRSFSPTIRTRRCTVTEQQGELMLTMILPLLRMLKSTSSPALPGRVSGLFKSEISHCIFNVRDPEKLFTVIDTILEDMTHTNSVTYTNLSNTAAMYLGKLLVKSASQEKRAEVIIRLTGAYSDLMKRWAADSKIPISGTVFTDYIRWVDELRKNRTS
ncbi:DNA polymerase phi-domain-containing protein [Lipomyces arxii]|uniref:DNA polymerase phi-domain-containing protein n=1 Tax=Lipomyces arxii TaxID=56418 RepID=UPI0034CF26C8